jgi:glyceraldehyde-3-phosphate dehydrogenase (ferredoxin)
MSHPSVLYELNVHLATGDWGVACPLDQSLVGPVQYGWDRFCKDSNSFVFGGGLLAGSPLPGTRRMIFCAYSPQWEGFYVSALGGAMYVFNRFGVNYVWLRGSCSTDSVLILNLKNGEYSARIEPVDADSVWQGYTEGGVQRLPTLAEVGDFGFQQHGRTWQGFYALQQYCFEKYKSEYEGDWFRILAVGPAARHTKEGAIGSNAISKGKVSHIDDWAGRGGLGSRLLQHHRVAAIVFGGDWQDPDLKAAKELDEYFLQRFNQRAIAADLALSQKYRYVPEFETGGTFGVNMHTADDRLLSFNYRSIYATDSERLALHKDWVLDHYLKQFNDEIIRPRNFAHCGEPCAVACKKFVGEYKKDYEPYAALGPLCGIFDQRAAERLTKFVDTMGLDSIQTGGTVAWIMELIRDGLLPPADFGLPTPTPDPSPIGDFTGEAGEGGGASARNADYAIAIVQMILFSPQGDVFRKGIRAAAKELDRRYGIQSLHRAVFVAHGEEGCMVPNQYWTPGMFAPMPLMGKYFSYYENKFIPPRQLGLKNVERFVYELYSENSGSCRFHRKWVEDIVDEIILSHFELDFDYWADQFKLAKAIHDHQSGASVFWESERVVDLIKGFLEKWERDGLREPELLEWIERFSADKWKAAREFWDEMYAGMAEAFEQGMDEPVRK